MTEILILIPLVVTSIDLLLATRGTFGRWSTLGLVLWVACLALGASMII